MKNAFRIQIGSHVSECPRGEDEPVVQNGLSLTPSKLLELHQSGMPISAQLSHALEAVRPDDLKNMYVPPEYRRGFDIADAFQSHGDFKDKLRGSVKRKREKDVFDAQIKEQVQNLQKE